VATLVAAASVAVSVVLERRRIRECERRLAAQDEAWDAWRAAGGDPPLRLVRERGAG
jgi:LPS sulfotransferase NodH